MSGIPQKFDSTYYGEDYFVTSNGKTFKKTDGTTGAWSYANPMGEWLGCEPIVKAWKSIFNPKNALDVGCGRGTFIAYERDVGIKAEGFDFSGWSVKNHYARCDKKWLKNCDATKPWPYSDKSFDLVTVLDLMEHIYLDDIDKVINEMYRVTKKWIFLQIATVDGSGNGGYILKKGESVPVELEGMAVAGHVTVQIKDFWIDKLMKGRNNKWKLRDDLVTEFISKVPSDVISNWVKNTILVIEKV
jgi:SAM-dependent methyltransferase